MEFKDNCGICRIAMTRHAVVRILPCRHLFHSKCFGLPNEPQVSCPLCRTQIGRSELALRQHYKKNSQEDRKRIVECANRGGDWVSLAATLGVKYKTAFHWIQSGRDIMLPRGGVKPKILTEEDVDAVISWIEAESGTTLRQLKEKIWQNIHKEVSVSTIGNYLEGRLFTLKTVHHEPAAMNTVENKRLRAQYVQDLNRYIEQGKQIVWLDETNFNLFCRRSKGRALAGSRAIQKLPAARGPNVHLIGAISAAGVVMMERRRGSFTAELANAWVASLLQRWQNLGNQLEDLVIVCDNAPCHSRLETVFDDTTAVLLRLAPYSPMLNPIEAIWSKIKCFVKTHITVPHVAAPGVGEQRIIYLEGLIDQAKDTVMGGDCARAAQHTTVHHAAALAMQDMQTGR